MSNITISLDFPHHFEVEVIDGAKSLINIGQAPVRIPDAGEDVDALTLRITPADSAAWVGRFARGFDGDHLANGVYAWPDGASLAVVSGGEGCVRKAVEEGK